MMPATVEITRLLSEWRDEQPDVLDRLLPLVYGELKKIARRQLATERPAHTLQPTALVHEAYLRLAKTEPCWQNRRQFFAVAGRLMHCLLVDHGRTRSALKRGGDFLLAPLDADNERATRAKRPETLAEVLDLDEALHQLAALDPRKCRAIQLRYLAGMTIEETATALDVSTATVILDTRLARAWLSRALRREATAVPRGHC